MVRHNSKIANEQKVKMAQKEKTKGENIFHNLFKIFNLHFFQFYLKHYEKEITIEDLPPCPEAMIDKYSDQIEHYWGIEIQNAKFQKRKPTLLRPLFQVFGSNFLLMFVFSIFAQLFLVLQAYALGAFVRDIKILNKISEDWKQIWIDGSWLVIYFFIYIQSINVYNVKTFVLGLRIRSAVSNLIYRKVLKLKKSAFLITSPGQITNLITNDVDKLENTIVYILYPPVIILIIIFVNYLLWPSISYSALVGSVTLLLIIPVQMLMGKSFSKYFTMSVRFTDERIRLMNEFINAMKIIKMYCWELKFAAKINEARKKEIRKVKNGMYLLSISQSLLFICSKLVIYSALVSFVLWGNLLEAEVVFLTYALLNRMSFAASMTVPGFVRFASASMVSLSRLSKFLMLPEMGDDEIVKNIEKLKNNEKPCIEIKNLFATYMHIGEEENLKKEIEKLDDLSDYKPVIKNINFECSPGDLLTIIGPVGSGKSSILYAILNEINILKGNMKVSGQISFSGQEAWTFTSTIMDNILFGADYDEKKYKEVLRVCGLERDMTLFPQGDQTLVGERGIALSGGQRARINLARALYYDADIYLLDDVLSAVDSKIAKHIFKEAIQGYLANKIVLLITHQLQFIRDSTNILLIREGEQLAFGDHGTLLETCKRIKFTKFLGFENNEENVEKSDKFDLTASVDETIDGLENRNKYLENSENLKLENDEKMKKRQIIRESTSLGLQTKVIVLYLKLVLNGWIGPSLLFFFVGAQVAYSYQDYFLSLWTTNEEKQNNEHIAVLDESSSFVDHFSQGENILFYSGLIILLFFMSIIRAASFFKACMNASVTLHDRLFKNVVSSPISFFETNPIGILLNRVSRDIGIVDEMLPIQFFEFLKTFTIDISIIILTVLLAPWTLIPFFILIMIIYAFRKLYLNTAKRIRMIEGATKSPVIQHISSTVNGLTTVRALQMQTAFKENFIIKQNTYNLAYGNYLLGARWFTYVLDSSQLIFLAGILIIAVLISDSVNSSTIGLIVASILNFASEFRWLFKNLTDVETQMTSVERLCQYSSLPQEPPIESEPSKKPSKNWPQHGRIEFRNVSMKYFEDEEPVLKNLNFKIEMNEKIGIVGRTGAGKSSIVGALFRMYGYEGDILIDDINTKTIGLHDLRNKISIIPQDPTLFNGTVRSNLDPLDEIMDDAVLWNVLEQTQLDKTIRRMPEGLESKITDSGSNFSTGLKQLVCLARAILKGSRILVMDEPTANADTETDKLIQNTVRNVFKDSTIITIAHRLNTIIDSDRVLVMDAGQVHEFDTPHNLLQGKKSLFYSMVHALDKRSINYLKKIAFKDESNSEQSEGRSGSTSSYSSLQSDLEDKRNM